MSETKTNQDTTSTTKTLANARRNEFVNEVIIQGRLIHKYTTAKATILTIRAGQTKTSDDCPKVVFFGSAKDEAAKYDVGDFVKVAGNIQSSKKDPGIKNQVLLSVFGESIGPAETQFEKDFNRPGKFAPIINHFKVAGYITAVDIPRNNLVRITVRCMKNERISFITLAYFSKDPARVVAEHLPGSFVRVYGSVQTSKKTPVTGNGAGAKSETRYYQSYVATELQ